MIAILGTGKMGEALLSGLLRAGRAQAEVAAVVRRAARAIYSVCAIINCRWMSICCWIRYYTPIRLLTTIMP